MKSCPTCHSAYPSHFSLCPRDGISLVQVGEWSEGMVIRGKYRILRKLGRGGMGAVYKAHHVIFDELRALKVMNAELMGDAMYVKRFEQEAVIARKLQHPNAVRVDDLDESEDGRPFIVMEYIEGASLRRVIDEAGPLPVGRTCAIAKQVAGALGAAHQIGMVHRDIKPANIVLIPAAWGERAKVLDFGIARLNEVQLRNSPGLTLTSPGMVIGTPQYMSPEQAAGKRGDQLDGRSDLYALGVVMYQMLTRKLPFSMDTTLELLMAHINVPPQAIQEMRPELPQRLAQLVMRCLEKDREKRPADSSALIRELQAIDEEQTGDAALPTVALDRNRLGQVSAAPAVAATLATAAQRSRTTHLPEPVPLTGLPAPMPPPVAVVPSDEAEMGQPRRLMRWLMLVAMVVLIAACLAAWRLKSHRPPRPSVSESSPSSRTLSQTLASGSAASRNSPAGTTRRVRGNPGHSAPQAVTAQHAVTQRVLPGPAGQQSAQVDEYGRPVAQRLADKSRQLASAADSSSVPGAESYNERPGLSDVIVLTNPGAQIYMDGKKVGTATKNGRLALPNLEPGSYNLRVMVAGFPAIAYSVHVAPDATDFVTARWRESQTPQATAPKPAASHSSAIAQPSTSSYTVTHEHLIGSCKGTLTIHNNSVQFLADDGKDSFSLPLDEITWGATGHGEFYVHLADGKNYKFRSNSTTAIIAALDRVR
jgi:serine/threonine protein kinase